ncbi:hypothetical protein [Maliponia aquimaris]|uniref:Uncharacterized protein n=1 Tax=Maliponia aquimaris TaxID=1673631 RepID=A0A238KLB9_9RHOB|nr:hypothetical protein [Maliponia aquimaris]SMX43548.1 hypothetical protein MAA8898_02853 [Maliponia aquimaris]
MIRLAPVLSLFLLSTAAAADVTCAEMQAALRVPPPAVGASEDPDGPLGCTRAALAMFEINKTALEQAAPPEDLSALHGTWLGDRVLSYLSGITVPGQELLVIGPGPEADTLRVTQYWMKAASPRINAPLWSEEGRYLGVTAEATLERQADGTLSVAGYGDEIVYGERQLEFERSHDLWTKTELNHFELPLQMRLHEDVLVLVGELRNPVTRLPRAYARSYTRVAPDAAELALAVGTAFALSQTRNFDCLAHQVSDGTGPLFEVLAPEGKAELEALVRELIGMGSRRIGIAEELRDATDDAERTRLRDEMTAWVERYSALTREGPQAALMQRIAEGSGGLCPDFF